MASAGLCFTRRWPPLWTSNSLAERHQAVLLCEVCPALAACRAWSMHLPANDGAVYGGLSATARLRLRRDRARPPATAPV